MFWGVVVIFYDRHSHIVFQETHQPSSRLFLTNTVQNAINMGPQMLDCSSCFGFVHEETLFLLSLSLLFNLPLGTTLGLEQMMYLPSKLLFICNLLQF